MTTIADPETNPDALYEASPDSALFTEDLAYYSHGSSLLFSLPGFGAAGDAYDSSFFESVSEDLSNFERLASLDAQTKNTIRPRIAHAIGRINGYEAWSSVLWQIEETVVWLLALIGLVVSLAFAPLMIDGGDGFWFWTGVTLTALVSFAIYLLVAFVLVQIDLRPLSKIISFLLLTYLLIAIPMLSDIIRIPTFIHDGALSGLVGGAVMVTLFTLWVMLHQFLHKMIWRRKNRKYPQEEILQTLAALVVMVEDKDPGWEDQQLTAQVILYLEWICQRLEHDLFRSLASDDEETNAWLKLQTRKMAASFRRLKRDILLPDGQSEDDLCQALADKLNLAALGRWKSLADGRPEEGLQVRTRRRRLLNYGRKVLALLLPLVILVVASLEQVDIPEPLRGTIITVAVGWAIVNIYALLEPGSYEKKVSSAERISKLLGKQ